MPRTITRPPLDGFPEAYHPYMSHLPEEDVLLTMERQLPDVRHMFKNMTDARAEESYEPGKWSIKELLQHLIDTERIMAYRALCISRGEQQALPGFDENRYAYNSLANIRTMSDLLEEYELVRRSNLALFRSFTSDMLDQVGTMNGNRISLRVLIHMMAAHEAHHIHILQTRYLKRK